MPWNQVMHKWGQGKLHSGSKSGKTVTNQRQAVAIMLSEKRKAEGGKTEYQPKSPAHRAVRRLARPSSFADGGTVQRSGMAMVHAGEQVKPAPTNNSPIAMRNAAAWNAPGGGYDQWKAGDPQREKELPIGGMAKQRDEVPAARALKKLRPRY